jgi:hypothetical protein
MNTSLSPANVGLSAQEAQFGRLVAARLSAGSENMSHDVGERLRVARMQAVARRRQPAEVRAAVVASNGVATLGAVWWARTKSEEMTRSNRRPESLLPTETAWSRPAGESAASPWPCQISASLASERACLTRVMETDMGVSEGSRIRGASDNRPQTQTAPGSLPGAV